MVVNKKSMLEVTAKRSTKYVTAGNPINTGLRAHEYVRMRCIAPYGLQVTHLAS